MMLSGCGGLAMTALRLLLAAGVLMATVGKSDAQQQKRDIFGITTAVPESQINSLLASVNIKCFADRGSSTRRCETRGGELTLVFTERLEPKRLYFIMFE